MTCHNCFAECRQRSVGAEPFLCEQWTLFKTAQGLLAFYARGPPFFKPQVKQKVVGGATWGHSPFPQRQRREAVKPIS